MREFFTKIQNNFWHHVFFKKALILLAVFAFSCSDNGCIDADDFGEYESQTIEVQTSTSENSCNYDPSKAPDDIDQGPFIKTCLISGKKSVTDENGSVFISNTDNGCLGFDEEKRSLCGYDCASKCQFDPSLSGSASPASSEPTWKSTDAKVPNKNSGITIWPGSQIMIRAVGNISLGNELEYGDIYVSAQNALPNASINFNTEKSSGLMIKFSGKWTDGADGASDSASDLTTGTAAPPTPIDTAPVLNAARRLVAYITPHPTGYSYVKSASYEESIRGSLLEPEPRVWKCDYAAGGNLRQSECQNMACASGANPYRDLGYSKANCQQTNDNFPINSVDGSLRQNLGDYGGVIRWNGDGLLGFDKGDPFIGINCNSGTCGTSSDPQRGKIINDIGDLAADTGVTIKNPSETDSYKISFKSLITSPACNINNLAVHIVDDNPGETGEVTEKIIYRFENGTTPTTGITDYGAVSVSNSSWSSRYISLEPKQKLILPQNLATTSSGNSCGKFIAVRFDKFHDIKINKSGFVNFTILGGSGNCNILGRIINSSGSHTNIDANYTSDFYEYNNFEAAPDATIRDPLNNLRVDASSSSSAMAWTSKSIFVRKNQTIRFAPESWNGNISTTGGNRECGIGLAMKIKPRPAILCKEKGNDLVANPECNIDITGGCGTADSICNNPTNTSQYCPKSTCRPSFSGCPLNKVSSSRGDITTKACPPSLISSFFNETGSGHYTAATCNAARHDAASTTDTTIPAVSSVTCSKCANALMLQTQEPDKKPVPGMDICYDLENYKGKADNIISDFDPSSIIKGKGLKRLGTFNGQYGNFEQFSDPSSTNDAGQKLVEADNIDAFGKQILRFRQSLIPDMSGVLGFFVADGNNFLDLPSAYSNNSPAGTAYDGSNGMIIKMSGMLDFSDGKWLEARLCENTSGASGNSCTSLPVQISDQPNIIDIGESSILGRDPDLGSSNYKFDNYGTLTRLTSPGVTGDCLKTDAVTKDNSLFYCHTKGISPAGVMDTTTINKLRLVFKINDPEVLNCDIPGTIGTSIDGVKKTNPLYDNSLAANVGALCASSIATDCKTQFICVNRYANNSGKYLVNIKVRSPEANKISGIISDVVNPVVDVMDGKVVTNPDGTKVRKNGQAERLYKALIADARYKAILTMSLILMVSFYGLGYLMGVSELNHSEIIGRVIKIGLIYYFTSETGWDHFNNFAVKFFKDGTDYLAFTMASVFDESSSLTRAIDGQEFYDKSVLFGSSDQVFNLFFSSVVQKKISALLFASLFGFIYLIIVYYGFLLYIYAIANAVLIYLTAQVFVSLLFTLGPLFFIFTLFTHTKEMFDNWLKQLISFSLQQVFLLTTLAFFNMMMYEVIKLALGYRICWDDVWTINLWITRVTLLSFWNIASLPPRIDAQSDVGNIGNPDGIPSLFSILFILVIASLMNKFITFMSNVAASIGGGIEASSLGSGIKSAVEGAKGTIGGYAKKAWQASGGKAIQRADKYLFDSGDLAKQERDALKAQDKTDSGNKKALSVAGKEAMSKFKRENGAKLAGMSQEQQINALKGVRDEAMQKTATKLGISDTELTRLKSDTGTKYRGHSITGYLAAKGSQRLSGASASLENQKIDTKLTAGQAKAAIRNAETQEERKAITDAVAKGTLQVGKSKKAKIFDGGKAAMKYAAIPLRVIISPFTGLVGAGKGVKKAWNSGKAALSAGNKGAATVEGFKMAGHVLGALGLHALHNTLQAIKPERALSLAKKREKGKAEYATARRELIRKGIITDLKPSAEWTRSDTEKNAIKTQVARNKALSSVSAAMNDPRSIVRMKEEEKFANTRDERKKNEADDPSTRRVFGDARENFSRLVSRGPKGSLKGVDATAARESLKERLRETAATSVQQGKAELASRSAASQEKLKAVIDSDPVLGTLDRARTDFLNTSKTDASYPQKSRALAEAKTAAMGSNNYDAYIQARKAHNVNKLTEADGIKHLNARASAASEGLTNIANSEEILKTSDRYDLKATEFRGLRTTEEFAEYVAKYKSDIPPGKLHTAPPSAPPAAFDGVVGNAGGTTPSSGDGA